MHESPTRVAVWDVKASRIDPEKSQIARRDDDRSFDRVRYEIRGKRNPDVAPALGRHTGPLHVTPHATPDPSDAVLNEIACVQRTVRALDVSGPDRADREVLRELSKSLSRVFEQARGLGCRLTDLSDELRQGALDRASHVGPVGLGSVPNALDVGDLAFVMRMSLNRHQLELQAAKTPESLLGVCESCRVELERALAALEQRFRGEPPPIARERGVEASLKCRRAYARLRAGVVEVGDVARRRAGSLKALRAAGALITLLIGSDGYPYFRASDRALLATLERRVVNYLEHGGSAARGVRIFQDFRAFVDQLSVINLRQDLKRHDASCLNHWLADLDDNDTGSSNLIDSVNKYREAIRGRDVQFDALLEGRATLTRAGLVNDLRRMLGSLVTGRDSEGSALHDASARTIA